MTTQSHETFTSFRKVSRSSNRRFGVTIGVILGLLSLAPMLHHQSPRVWLLVLGLISLLLGLLAPAVLGPVNQLWYRFGLLLGRITNPVIMGILFFGVMVPLGWFLRWRGHDLLRLKRESAAKSYWLVRDAKVTTSSLRKQF